MILLDRNEIQAKAVFTCKYCKEGNFRSIEVLENGPVGSAVSDIPGPDP